MRDRLSFPRNLVRAQPDANSQPTRRMGQGVLAAAILISASLQVTAGSHHEPENDSKADPAFIRPESRNPTLINLCTADASDPPEECKDGAFHKLALAIEEKLTAALAKARPATVPLLKRDAYWFAGALAHAEADGAAEAMKQRAAVLDEIAQGFGRSSPVGRWANAFGWVEITPAGAGGFQVKVETKGLYGTVDGQAASCWATAQVKADEEGWLSGASTPEAATNAPLEAKPAIAGQAAQMQSARLRLRMQGETLRAVMDHLSDADATCTSINQVTGSYFAVGGSSTSASGTPPFTAPTFDCARPDTAAEEEICADPELAENDVRLNRAWEQLLPRLDATAKTLLKKDQKAWVRAQAVQFPVFLHPAWDKRLSQVHQTTLVRKKMRDLQRERIAMLEGFDEQRKGLTGLWFANNAVIAVTPAGKDKIVAEGWKWEQGAWKDGCEYKMEGTAKNGAFISDQKGPNPDTLERDGVTLIVNRRDAALAPQRKEADDDPKAGSMKCNRDITISSTVRLFPVKPTKEISAKHDDIR